MGTLHEMVTWDKKTLVRKRKQWGKKNKEPRSFKKLISFLFKLIFIKLLNVIISQIHFNTFGTALEAGLYPGGGANIRQCSYLNFPPWGPQDP